MFLKANKNESFIHVGVQEPNLSLYILVFHLEQNNWMWMNEIVILNDN
jgi:hypothetical protein